MQVGTQAGCTKMPFLKGCLFWGCRVKQGKRLSEFLQKYTYSGTETTHLAGYNILVFKYVKISAGLPLLFIGAIREKSSKSDIA